MPRIAIVGDVHGNLPALNAVLSHCGECDALWCIGDTVGYGPYPRECVEKVESRGAVAVAGNHDLGSIGKIDLLSFNLDARDACRWTGEVLGERHTRYLDLLPLRSTPQPDSLLVHGSPRDPVWEYVISVEQASPEFKSFHERLCFHGHSHTPAVFTLDMEAQAEAGTRGVELLEPSDGESIRLDDRLRYLVNVGSVGQPRDGDARSCYVIYDADSQLLTYHRVEYPVVEVQKEMARVGLPDFLIRRLSRGR